MRGSGVLHLWCVSLAGIAAGESVSTYTYGGHHFLRLGTASCGPDSVLSPQINVGSVSIPGVSKLAYRHDPSAPGGATFVDPTTQHAVDPAWLRKHPYLLTGTTTGLEDTGLFAPAFALRSKEDAAAFSLEAHQKARRSGGAGLGAPAYYRYLNTGALDFRTHGAVNANLSASLAKLGFNGGRPDSTTVGPDGRALNETFASQYARTQATVDAGALPLYTPHSPFLDPRRARKNVTTSGATYRAGRPFYRYSVKECPGAPGSCCIALESSMLLPSENCSETSTSVFCGPRNPVGSLLRPGAPRPEAVVAGRPATDYRVSWRAAGLVTRFAKGVPDIGSVTPAYLDYALPAAATAAQRRVLARYAAFVDPGTNTAARWHLNLTHLWGDNPLPKCRTLPTASGSSQLVAFLEHFHVALHGEFGDTKLEQQENLVRFEEGVAELVAEHGDNAAFAADVKHILDASTDVSGDAPASMRAAYVPAVRDRLVNDKNGFYNDQDTPCTHLLYPTDTLERNRTGSSETIGDTADRSSTWCLFRRASTFSWMLQAMLRTYQRTNARFGSDVVDPDWYAANIEPLAGVTMAGAPSRSLVPDFIAPSKMKALVYRKNRVLFWNLDTTFDIPGYDVATTDVSPKLLPFQNLQRLRTTAPVCGGRYPDYTNYRNLKGGPPGSDRVLPTLNKTICDSYASYLIDCEYNNTLTCPTDEEGGRCNVCELAGAWQTSPDGKETPNLNPACVDGSRLKELHAGRIWTAYIVWLTRTVAELGASPKTFKMLEPDPAECTKVADRLRADFPGTGFSVGALRRGTSDGTPVVDPTSPVCYVEPYAPTEFLLRAAGKPAGTVSGLSTFTAATIWPADAFRTDGPAEPWQGLGCPTDLCSRDQTADAEKLAYIARYDRFYRDPADITRRGVVNPVVVSNRFQVDPGMSLNATTGAHRTGVHTCTDQSSRRFHRGAWDFGTRGYPTALPVRGTASCEGTAAFYGDGGTRIPKRRIELFFRGADLFGGTHEDTDLRVTMYRGSGAGARLSTHDGLMQPCHDHDAAQGACPASSRNRSPYLNGAAPESPLTYRPAQTATPFSWHDDSDLSLSLNPAEPAFMVDFTTNVMWYNDQHEDDQGQVNNTAASTTGCCRRPSWCECLTNNLTPEGLPCTIELFEECLTFRNERGLGAIMGGLRSGRGGAVPAMPPGAAGGVRLQPFQYLFNFDFCPRWNRCGTQHGTCTPANPHTWGRKGAASIMNGSSTGDEATGVWYNLDAAAVSIGNFEPDAKDRCWNSMEQYSRGHGAYGGVTPLCKAVPGSAEAVPTGPGGHACGSSAFEAEQQAGSLKDRADYRPPNHHPAGVGSRIDPRTKCVEAPGPVLFGLRDQEEMFDRDLSQNRVARAAYGARTFRGPDPGNADFDVPEPQHLHSSHAPYVNGKTDGLLECPSCYDQSSWGRALMVYSVLKHLDVCLGHPDPDTPTGDDGITLDARREAYYRDRIAAGLIYSPAELAARTCRPFYAALADATAAEREDLETAARACRDLAGSGRDFSVPPDSPARDHAIRIEGHGDFPATCLCTGTSGLDFAAELLEVKLASTCNCRYSLMGSPLQVGRPPSPLAPEHDYERPEILVGTPPPNPFCSCPDGGRECGTVATKCFRGRLGIGSGPETSPELVVHGTYTPEEWDEIMAVYSDTLVFTPLNDTFVARPETMAFGPSSGQVSFLAPMPFTNSETSHLSRCIETGVGCEADPQSYGYGEAVLTFPATSSSPWSRAAILAPEPGLNITAAPGVALMASFFTGAAALYPGLTPVMEQAPPLVNVSCGGVTPAWGWTPHGSEPGLGPFQVYLRRVVPEYDFTAETCGYLVGSVGTDFTQAFVDRFSSDDVGGPFGETATFGPMNLLAVSNNFVFNSTGPFEVDRFSRVLRSCALLYRRLGHPGVSASAASSRRMVTESECYAAFSDYVPPGSVPARRRRNPTAGAPPASGHFPVVDVRAPDSSGPGYAANVFCTGSDGTPYLFTVNLQNNTKEADYFRFHVPGQCVSDVAYELVQLTSPYVPAHPNSPNAPVVLQGTAEAPSGSCGASGSLFTESAQTMPFVVSPESEVYLNGSAGFDWAGYMPLQLGSGILPNETWLRDAPSTEGDPPCWQGLDSVPASIDAIVVSPSGRVGAEDALYQNRWTCGDKGIPLRATDSGSKMGFCIQTLKGNYTAGGVAAGVLPGCSDGCDCCVPVSPAGCDSTPTTEWVQYQWSDDDLISFTDDSSREAQEARCTQSGSVWVGSDAAGQTPVFLAGCGVSACCAPASTHPVGLHARVLGNKCAYYQVAPSEAGGDNACLFASDGSETPPVPRSIEDLNHPSEHPAALASPFIARRVAKVYRRLLPLGTRDVPAGVAFGSMCSLEVTTATESDSPAYFLTRDGLQKGPVVAFGDVLSSDDRAIVPLQNASLPGGAVGAAATSRHWYRVALVSQPHRPASGSGSGSGSACGAFFAGSSDPTGWPACKAAFHLFAVEIPDTAIGAHGGVLFDADGSPSSAGASVVPSIPLCPATGSGGNLLLRAHMDPESAISKQPVPASTSRVPAGVWCIDRCRNVPGCASVYFHPGPDPHAGTCYLYDSTARGVIFAGEEPPVGGNVENPPHDTAWAAFCVGSFADTLVAFLEQQQLGFEPCSDFGTVLTPGLDGNTLCAHTNCDVEGSEFVSRPNPALERVHGDCAGEKVEHAEPVRLVGISLQDSSGETTNLWTSNAAALDDAPPVSPIHVAAGGSIRFNYSGLAWKPPAGSAPVVGQLASVIRSAVVGKALPLVGVYLSNFCVCPDPTTPGATPGATPGPCTAVLPPPPPAQIFPNRSRLDGTFNASCNRCSGTLAGLGGPGSQGLG